ncbi:hypothetical protein LMG28614_06452 [Paraburkholderia ultramafica]|uniref:DUF3658 domain-containing protein n=1 Tax=Paraburkholderia ultramafica TaxID=1544867 RepID=A0A6S7BN18_9BURK|nr:DUF3658 domain-containing protein [Paraburkholderia ultramafica]CAB3806750.1 hypothetical protein LMG28614_06452 [Paraburkholderia ultramafica]
MNEQTEEYEDDFDDEADDPPLTATQQAAADRLTEADLRIIDTALFRNLTGNYRKVAMIVSLGMGSDTSFYPDIIDVFYAQRIKLMVKKGLVESVGNLNRMRYSEVRLPQPASGQCISISNEGPQRSPAKDD